MEHSYNKKNKNILVRQIEKQDLELLRSWRNNPENCKYLTPIPHITEDAQKKWYMEYLKDKEQIIFAIEETEKLGRCVGSIALYNFKDSSVEVGKIMVGDPDAHGLHVALHALEAVMEVAVQHLGIKRFYLHVFKNNLPALITYKRVGFKKTSEEIKPNGEVEYRMEKDTY